MKDGETYVNNNNGRFYKREDDKLYVKAKGNVWKLCDRSFADVADVDFQKVDTVYAVGTRLKIKEESRTISGKIAYISNLMELVFVECGEEEIKYRFNVFSRKIKNGIIKIIK